MIKTLSSHNYHHQEPHLFRGTPLTNYKIQKYCCQMVKILVVLKLLKITWLVQSSPQVDQPHNQVHEGTCQKRFSGFCPLKGGGYPPNSIKGKIHKKVTVLLKGGGKWSA